jgi:hypothetical protein
MQEDMIKMLNEGVPVKKHLAFLPTAFTSHPVVVCKDQDDEEHQLGLSVVRHWANNFQF